MSSETTRRSGRGSPRGPKQSGKVSSKLDDVVAECAGRLALLSPKDRGAAFARLCGAFGMYPKGNTKSARIPSKSRPSPPPQTPKRDDNKVVDNTGVGSWLKETTSLIRQSNKDSKISRYTKLVHDYCLATRAQAKVYLNENAETPESYNKAVEEVQAKLLPPPMGDDKSAIALSDVKRLVKLIEFRESEGTMPPFAKYESISHSVIEVMDSMAQCVRLRKSPSAASRDEVAIACGRSDPETNLYEVRNPEEAAFFEKRKAQLKAAKGERKRKAKASPILRPSVPDKRVRDEGDGERMDQD